jgi:uncharacterized protein
MDSFVLGLISDTHGLLRAEAFSALQGCQSIIHAGDVGDRGILDQLNTIAPVHAVRGNVDTEPWCKSLPATAVVQLAGTNIYVLHNREGLDLDPKAASFQIIVSGHTHKPHSHWRDGVLYINPGSAGPRRFSLPISLARLDLLKTPWQPEFIEL